MNRLNWKTVQKRVNSMSLRERALILITVLALILSVWWVFALEALNEAQAQTQSRINGVVNQITGELNRNQQVRNTYTRDPNAFARNRRDELRAQVDDINERILNLYGELILPTQMANILTQILQSDTTLNLIGLENLEPESLIEGAVGSNVQVYKHGIRLTMQGEYLETIRFLKKIEDLNANFFWDSLDFQVLEHPDARITLNIFTLSTQRGFIGV